MVSYRLRDRTHVCVVSAGPAVPASAQVGQCGVAGIAHGLYSSVAERQYCKLKVLGSIPSGGSVALLAESRCTHHPGEVVQHLPTTRTHRRSAAEGGTRSLVLPRAACAVSPDRGHRRWHPLSGRAPAPRAEGAGSHAGRGQQKSAFTHTGCHVHHPVPATRNRARDHLITAKCLRSDALPTEL